MRDFRSHVMFTREQRNGIFLLVVLIVVFQSIYFYVDFSSEEVQVNQQALTAFTNEIDSLKREQIEDLRSKQYPFNPNYITDYKGSVLGMSNEEIDRLLAYRKQNKWINSTKQFQEVTQVSDSLLHKISPFFKFPEWVNSPKTSSNFIAKQKVKTFSQKQDLNVVSEQQLQKVSGVGKVLSERIVKFRNTKKGGFAADVELMDVYGLSPEVIENLTNQFTVKTPRKIKRIDLNAATLDNLVTIPHIDYDLAYNIVEQRQLREGYKSVTELTKVKDFPANKIKIIELYLHIEKEK